MRFAVVSDNREWSEPGRLGQGKGAPACAGDVEAEAWRRKAALRLDEWRMREFVTGLPVPDEVSQLCYQIDLAVAALERMSPIPADFRDDVYWPRVW